MIITVHQPEYLPYIGFFQRLAKSDIFVVLDDVGYQKNAFINRNKIKTADGWQWVTVPVKGRSPNLKINEVFIENNLNWQSQQLKALISNYSKATFFKDYFPFFEDTFKKKWEKISDLDIYLLENICRFLDINISIKRSSELKIEGKGTDRLINISKKLGAKSYLSGPGNEEHQVEKEKFEENGIRVNIAEFSNLEYNQLFMRQGFLPYMSIIDLLFNEGKNSAKIIRAENLKK